MLLAGPVNAQSGAQCSADANLCQQTCAGIGLYSAFRRDAEASKKMEQCNSRCESEKAKCEVQAGGAAKPGPVGGPSGGSVPPPTGRRFGDSACPAEDLQHYQEAGENYVSYKPLDCITVEWRRQTKYLDRGDSGMEARIANRCACRVQYRHVGELRGVMEGTSIVDASGVGGWRSEFSGAKKFEVIRPSSCHYTDELIGMHNVKTGRCVARQCRNGSYGSCGYSTTR